MRKKGPVRDVPANSQNPYPFGLPVSLSNTSLQRNTTLLHENDTVGGP